MADPSYDKSMRELSSLDYIYQADSAWLEKHVSSQNFETMKQLESSPGFHEKIEAFRQHETEFSQNNGPTMGELTPAEELANQFQKESAARFEHGLEAGTSGVLGAISTWLGEVFNPGDYARQMALTDMAKNIGELASAASDAHELEMGAKEYWEDALPGSARSVEGGNALPPGGIDFKPEEQSPDGEKESIAPAEPAGPLIDDPNPDPGQSANQDSANISLDPSQAPDQGGSNMSLDPSQAPDPDGPNMSVEPDQPPDEDEPDGGLIREEPSPDNASFDPAHAAEQDNASFDPAHAAEQDNASFDPAHAAEQDNASFDPAHAAEQDNASFDPAHAAEQDNASFDPAHAAEQDNASFDPAHAAEQDNASFDPAHAAEQDNASFDPAHAAEQDNASFDPAHAAEQDNASFDPGHSDAAQSGPQPDDNFDPGSSG